MPACKQSGGGTVGLVWDWLKQSGPGAKDKKDLSINEATVLKVQTDLGARRNLSGCQLFRSWNKDTHWTDTHIHRS